MKPKVRAIAAELNAEPELFQFKANITYLIKSKAQKSTLCIRPDDEPEPLSCPTCDQRLDSRDSVFVIDVTYGIILTVK